MPVARFQMPDGRVARFEVPDGTSPEQAQSMISEHLAQSGKETVAPVQDQDSSILSDIGQGLGNAVAGAVRGAGSIGSTIIAPYDIAKDAIAGKGLSLESNRERRAAIDEGLRTMGANPDSLLYQGGKLGGEIAGTAGVGGVLGNAVRGVSQAPRALALANALQTGGMRAGSVPGAANMATRVAGGGITGGTMAGLVDPSQAKTGAIVGAALPPALMATGKAARAVGRSISGPQVPAAVRQSVQAARNLGYVIPPSQAKPTLANRALEGFSGKITTAQNASARNQQITNALAKKAIGATELSEAGLAQVRQNANAAYDVLGGVGAFHADDAFVRSLDKAGASTAELRRNFPELVNSEVDDLIAGLKSRGQFDAQPTIEAIKQFRSSASANRISADPAKKALGRAQSKIAGSLEDMIDRNLQRAGNPQLLSDYRNARQTLAKVYDVEKALNTASGNVDAAKLANVLKKGKPITGELRQIAEFSAQFPKATQTVERMGSLPQVSPLDFGALGTVSALTSNPALMAGVLARPAARQAVLSDFVQNGLLKSGPGPVSGLLLNPELQQLLYRAAPVAATSR